MKPFHVILIARGGDLDGKLCRVGGFLSNGIY